MPSQFNVGSSPNDGTGDPLRTALVTTNNAIGSWLNPLNEGCFGDSATDDTSAFQTLILKARNSKNQAGILLPMNYFYKISAPLNFAGVSVIGAAGSSIACGFLPSSSFSGSSLILIDGDTGGGAGREMYANFWINGGKSVLGSAVAGLKINKSCIYNMFQNIHVNNTKGKGIILSAAAGLRPSLCIFDNVTVNDSDDDGWEIRGGFSNTFRACGSENNYGIAWNIDSLDEIVALSTWERCWVEHVGTNTTLGQNPVGQTGFYISLADKCKFIQNVVSSYGINPVGAGHAFDVQNCNLCEFDANDPSYNNSGASGASSKKFNVVGGSRNKIRFTTGTTTAADVNIAAADTQIENAWVNAIADVIPIHTANSATAITTGATVFLQPFTGLDDPTETNVLVLCPGRMHFCNLYVHSATNPGGAQTYTVTLMKNQSPTALTVTVNTGNFTNVSDVADEVDMVAGSQYSFKVVSSASAATLPRGQLHISLGMRR